MLVLSRHRDESIMIGDDIVVTVVDIRGDKVRLGIQAPATMPVHREEVYNAIKREHGAPRPIPATERQLLLTKLARIEAKYSTEAGATAEEQRHARELVKQLYGAA